MQNLMLHQVLNERSQSTAFFLGILSLTFKGGLWRPASFSHDVSSRGERREPGAGGWWSAGWT